MSLENKNLSIKSVDDLLRCINSASLLEIAGWPKPGNIHRTKDFEGTRFEHLLISIASVQPNFRDFCKSVYKYSINIGEDYSFVKLGYFFREATKEMMRAQKGGNTILGHILILAPLAAAAAICLKSKNITIKNFLYNIKKVINDSTVRDTMDLYEAINSCNPGGLGSVEKYDLNDKNAIKDIKSDKITLKRIFELSKERDLISQEYSTGFTIIVNEGLPYFLQIFDQTNDINKATVNTFLKILADHPDSLITRKSGKEAAEMISNRAKKIISKDGISSKEGLILANGLDEFLHEKKGKMNPGTTADIVAGIIFCALIFGLKF